MMGVKMSAQSDMSDSKIKKIVTFICPVDNMRCL